MMTGVVNNKPFNEEKKIKIKFHEMIPHRVRVNVVACYTVVVVRDIYFKR